MSLYDPTPIGHPIQLFRPEIDPTTQGRTGLWWGPESENGAIRSFFFDGEQPVVEFFIQGYPDLSETDAREYAQEILDYIDRYNTRTVFDAGIDEVAA